MRLFVAINFGGDTRSALAKTRDALCEKSKQGNFTLTENIHLTLAFLGECDKSQLEAAKLAMNEVEFEPFDLTMSHMGKFERGADGSLWWVGVKESEALLSLQRDLVDRLRAAGFNSDMQKFSPHITIARKVMADIKLWTMESVTEKVCTIDLMKSERVDGKLTYTSIHRRGKWADPIVVEDYNPMWASEFERLEAYIMPHIGDLAVKIHHVGSTSVPGLAAKPIIDFDIEIPRMDMFPIIRERLDKLGYTHKGDYGIEGREAFGHDLGERFMRHNMYVCPSDSEELRRHLKFRDYLRENPDSVAEYGELKAALARECVNDIDAYIDGKSGFIRGILEKNSC